MIRAAAVRSLLVLLTLAASPLAAAGSAGELAVRFALVVGTRGDAPLPDIGEVLSERLMADYLSQWDPNSDNPEIRRLFALRGLSEVTRQAARLPAEGGELSGTSRVGDQLWRIEVAVHAAHDVATFDVRISRDGELVSAPTVAARLGEKAIVSVAGESSSLLLFVVVEAELWESGAEPAKAAAAEEIVRPKLVDRVMPDYPRGEGVEPLQGVVVVAMRVGTDGAVRDARVERGLAPAFDEAALAAVRQWRFEPAMEKGRPVEVEFRVTINFVPDSAKREKE
jgi:TonB family protein